MNGSQNMRNQTDLTPALSSRRGRIVGRLFERLSVSNCRAFSNSVWSVEIAMGRRGGWSGPGVVRAKRRSFAKASERRQLCPTEGGDFSNWESQISNLKSQI